MIRKETNVTFDWCADKVFERAISDTYYIREITTGDIYAEAVNTIVNINDFEEVLDMPLPVIPDEEI